MVFDQPWCGVGVEVFDDRAVANVDLFALDFRRHRNNDGEVFDVAIEVISHRDNGPVAVAYEHDL